MLVSLPSLTVKTCSSDICRLPQDLDRPDGSVQAGWHGSENTKMGPWSRPLVWITRTVFSYVKAAALKPATIAMLVAVVTLSGACPR